MIGDPVQFFIRKIVPVSQETVIRHQAVCYLTSKPFHSSHQNKRQAKHMIKKISNRSNLHFLVGWKIISIIGKSCAWWNIQCLEIILGLQPSFMKNSLLKKIQWAVEPSNAVALGEHFSRLRWKSSQGLLPLLCSKHVLVSNQNLMKWKVVIC